MKNYKDSMLNKKHGKTQKSEVYYGAYSHMFSRFDNLAKLTILEIGVRDGGGLYTLKEHFPNATIVGLDIDSTCMQWENINNNIFVRIGDQSDTNLLQSLVEEFGEFDLVIDDGSHICSHQIKSFECLFPKLKYNGLYIIEDLHTSYWKSFYEGTGQSAIEYFKELSVMPTKRWACNASRSVVANMSEITEIEYRIDSVHFYDSICFISKVATDIDLEGLISNYKQYFVTQ
jgi:hypothetical protein